MGLEAKVTSLISKSKETSVTNADLSELLELMQELDRREEYSGFKKRFQAGTPYSLANLPKHDAFMAATLDYRELLLLGGNRCLLEGTLVATPTGPVPIEKLLVGDTVYDCYGAPTKVTATWDNGEASTIRLTNRNKEWLECTPNHELDCQESRRERRRLRLRADRIINETQVRRVYVKSPLGQTRYTSAYALGAMLGDGCCTEGTKTSITISSRDTLVVEKAAEELNTTYRKRAGNNYSWKIDVPSFEHYDTFCKDKKAHEKGIDIEVLKTWDRESLLRFVAGLHDTDGHLSQHRDGYQLGFTSQSLSLIEAYKYAFLALWQEPLSVSKDGRKKYVNGPCYTAYSRNPHSIARICEELLEFVAHKYKATIKEMSVGSRSYADKLSLKVSGIGRGRVYDITVEHPEHFFLLANGLSVSNSGKTQLGAIICSILATGQYPEWWRGISFDGPVQLWACGKTGQSTRDTVQDALMGPPGAWGTGMIPAECIGKTVRLPGTPNAIDTVEVLHTSGKWSTIGFKSYKQEAPSFYGTAKHLVWLDEPCPEDIYNECLIRTATTNGRLIHTITPKEGLTRLLADFLASCDLLAGTERIEGIDKAVALMKMEEQSSGVVATTARQAHHRGAIAIGWDDVPWMSEDAKKEILESTPPHLRETVSQGIPTIGDGAVYSMPLADLLLKPEQVFPIPAHYKKLYGMDVGWNRCVAKDSMVMMADGVEKAIQDVQVGEEVLAFDFATENLVPTKVVDTFVGHANNMVTVGISKEQLITCTDDHPFAHRGAAKEAIKFKKVRDIKDRIREFQSVVLPSKWELTAEEFVCSPEMARVVGYLLGDGCLTYTNRRLEFAQTIPEYIDDMRNCLKSVGCEMRSYENNTAHHICGTVAGSNPVLDFIRKLGLLGTTSSTKFIPPVFFKANKEVIKNLLVGLIHTDGSVEGDHVRYYTVSSKLAAGVKTLCLRLGIYTSLSRDARKRKPTHKDVLRVTLRRPTSLPLMRPKELVATRVERKVRADRLLSVYEAAPDQDIYCITVAHPDHAFVCNGFVVSNTAAVFGAQDPDTGVLYIYAEHYVEHQPPEVHAQRIKDIAGDWMVGAIDPASKITTPDGKDLLTTYRRHGLRLREANNSVETGIMKVYSMMAAGKLKLFPHTTTHLQNEYLIYRRDNNKIVKEDDHAMDALRYLVSRLEYARPTPSSELGVFGMKRNQNMTHRRYNV